MIVSCPHCKKDVGVSKDSLKSGVLPKDCPHCNQTFVIRLGEPTDETKKGSEDALEGVRASGSDGAYQGEIGAKIPPRISPETLTKIRVDRGFQKELAKAIISETSDAKVTTHPVTDEVIIAPPSPPISKKWVWLIVIVISVIIAVILFQWLH